MLPGMKLKDYLEFKKLTPAEFGERVDASEHAVLKWARGERTPRPVFMQRIAQSTERMVTANDFVEEAQ
jgi:transcriptional regulator with XRE-family HTH domain